MKVGKLLAPIILYNWSLNHRLFKKKQLCVPQFGWNLPERWQGVEPIWRTCGCLYQHLSYSFNLSLSLWSLSKLPCARFCDPLKMNIVSTLCFSWWTNFVTVWLAMCELVWRCFHKIFITLSLSLILMPYLLGRRKILVTMFILEAWRAFGSLEGFWYFVGFGVQLLASSLGSKFWNLCCVQCAHGNMHLLVGNGPLGKGLWFDTSSIWFLGACSHALVIFSWVQWFAILLAFWILMTTECRPVFWGVHFCMLKEY
jgi:hypothetical protein